MVKNSFIEFQCVPATYVTENKDIYFDIYTCKVSCPLSLPFLNLPICQSELKYLSLYCKLFIFAWQLYLHIWVHELTLRLPGSCVVVYLIVNMFIFSQWPDHYLLFSANQMQEKDHILLPRIYSITNTKLLMSDTGIQCYAEYQQIQGTDIKIQYLFMLDVFLYTTIPPTHFIHSTSSY